MKKTAEEGGEPFELEQERGGWLGLFATKERKGIEGNLLSRTEERKKP